MIQCIDHLNIVVTDLQKSKAFFEVLGFQAALSSDLDGVFLEKVTGLGGLGARFVAMQHESGAMRIELLEYAPAKIANGQIGMANEVGFRHLAFQVENIEKTVDALKALGVVFLSPVQTWEKTGKRLVYFWGPDGILMELCQYPDPTVR
ncbi:VOC family protein [Desulfobotulus sp.]|jgi:catechol 2,3-dioxygenase-like lactoylglutathione lyase family enzyme|uniref:VOC family protein n=1 Tax=Desulfobotulus sp. TaxID=1940337 RepID=UPI002A35E56E|nr:VOC family protein [Desulfobotulus sp.]MDY0161948.1 VOC family protein [Desulfobotulus sp.]